MPKLGVYTLPDGSVSIFNPWRKTSAPGVVPETFSSEHPLRREGESDDDLVVRLTQKLMRDRGHAGTVALIDATDKPSVRTFRNAWENGGGRVTVNMTKARVIHKQRLTEQADAKLAKLRGDINAADDRGDNAELARQKKKRKDLRAALDGLDAALAAITDPAALAAFVPPELAV